MKYSLLFLGLCISNLVFSQVELVKTVPSGCDLEYDRYNHHNNVYNLNNRIVSISRIEDTTIVEISVAANCGISSECFIEIESDTINFVYENYETMTFVNEKDGTIVSEISVADCDCCFSFIFYLTGLENKTYSYKGMGVPIELSEDKYKYSVIKSAPEYFIYQNDTIGHINLYGFKQNFFIDSTLNLEFFYKDDILLFFSKWKKEEENKIKKIQHIDYNIEYLYNHNEVKKLKDCIEKYSNGATNRKETNSCIQDIDG